MWLALKLLASGAFDAVVRGLSSAGKWLLEDWRNLFVVLFGGAALWQGWVTIPARDRMIADTEALLTATQLAHLGTIENFIDASAEAQRQAEANVARVKAEQEEITDASLSDLRSDLAAVTARFDRLRAQNAAAGNPRRADAAGLPGTGSAPARAAGAPSHPDIRAAGDLIGCPPGLVCLTIDQAERASQDAHRHNTLIDWVIAQSAIRFAPEESPE